MIISSYKYLSTSAIKSLKRNLSLSIASMATVAASLFIIAVFFIVSLTINQGINGVESKFEARIFLKDDITDSQKEVLKVILQNLDEVVSLTYESKEQALVNLRNQLGTDNKAILEGLDKDNPLPQAYVVKVKKPEMLTDVVDSIKNMPGIDTIRDGRDVVKTLTTITNTIRWSGVVLFVLFISVALFLIGNTIKLAVYSRRREIGIMKYIGATDWFIKIPFIIEGMLIGIGGAIVASVVVCTGYLLVYEKFSSSLGSIIALIQPSFILSYVWIFILAGIVIGAAGSTIAVKKFLSV